MLKFKKTLFTIFIIGTVLLGILLFALTWWKIINLIF